jgi:hypothetical protein
MQYTYSSVYARRAFTVDNPSSISRLTLSIDYDDGFVAYLNGVEIARENVTGNPPAYNALADISHEAGVFPTSKYDVDPALLVPGTNVLSIQGHNVELFSSDLSIIPWLTIYPVPDIKANGSDDPVIINQGDNINVSIALDPVSYDGVNADWFILMFYLDTSWHFMPLAVFQSPLFSLPDTTLIDTTGLAPGMFLFFFGVDLNPDGVIDAEWYYDGVMVGITP